MREFEARCQANPNTLQDVALCFQRVRNIRDFCSEFKFTTYPTIHALWESSASHHTLLYPPATKLFYHQDIGLMHQPLRTQHVQQARIAKRHALHGLALRKAKQQKEGSTSILASWDAVLGESMKAHVVQLCRADSHVCKLTFISVPAKSSQVLESSEQSLGAFSELHVLEQRNDEEDQESSLGALCLEVDDGTGTQVSQPQSTRAPSALAFFRIMHAAPYRQHLVRKLAQFEDMLVTVHSDLHQKLTAMGEQHDVAALPAAHHTFSTVLSLATLRCSPKDVRVWTRGDARFYLRGHEEMLTEDHILAVTALVRAGAWGNTDTTLQELKDEPLVGLSVLHSTGEVDLSLDTAVYRSWRLLAPEKVLVILSATPSIYLTTGRKRTCFS